MSAMDITHPAFSGLDLLASAVLLIDDQQLIRYVNASGENLLAISSRSVIGKPLEPGMRGDAVRLLAPFDPIVWDRRRHCAGIRP